MGTQILAGSVGKYKLLNKSDATLFGNTEFTVTQNTCLEAEKLPVKFIDSAEGHETWIYMHEAELINPKLKDY